MFAQLKSGWPSQIFATKRLLLCNLLKITRYLKPSVNNNSQHRKTAEIKLNVIYCTFSSYQIVVALNDFQCFKFFFYNLFQDKSMNIKKTDINF